MREILFKAKRTDTDTWTEGNLLSFDSRRYIINDAESIYHCPQCDREEMREMWFAVIPETVSQFTGLYDKNGVRIFENDIVVIGGNKLFPTTIEFLSGSWQCVKKYTNKGREKEYSYLHRLEYDNPNKYEVIGNRLNNPELLKGK